MEDSLLESIKEIKNDEDFVSILDITYNKSFNEFIMIVDQDKFENSFDGFATLSLGMSGMFYQVFDGAPNNKVTVHIKKQRLRRNF